MEHRLHKGHPMTGPKRRSQATGFTIIEILIVVGIFAAMAAVALPNISGYVQAIRVRTAQDQVASAIQRARGRAISLNSQWGVSFVIERPGDGAVPGVFWIHIEDPEAATAQSGRQPLDSGSPNRNLSTRYELDPNVVFGMSGVLGAPASCPAGATAGNQSSMRFDRYGTRAFPGVGAVPALAAPTGPTATGILMTTADADASICLVDLRNGLFRMVTIARGGRVKKG